MAVNKYLTGQEGSEIRNSMKKCEVDYESTPLPLSPPL